MENIRGLDDRVLLQILSEVVATSGDLRAQVNPKYRFDEHMLDLERCLLLDGFIIQDKELVQTDPSIADAVSMEDDLTLALKSSGAPHAQEIIDKINDSAAAFRSSPPDYNASLTNARIALETLAKDVAADVGI